MSLPLRSKKIFVKELTSLIAGTYFAEIIQASNNKKVKLIMIH
jgi:hypothetical protein